MWAEFHKPEASGTDVSAWSSPQGIISAVAAWNLSRIDASTGQTVNDPRTGAKSASGHDAAEWSNMHSWLCSFSHEQTRTQLKKTTDITKTNLFYQTWSQTGSGTLPFRIINDVILFWDVVNRSFLFLESKGTNKWNWALFIFHSGLAWFFRSFHPEAGLK